MPRAHRLHAPGCIIHITARTRGGQPWLAESLRPRIAHEIALAGSSSGHRVIAYAIMPNHFHVIIRQGAAPLDHLMHRVMHRTAAMLTWTHRLEGHVFERRYWSGVCLDPDYARAAILYVHLNPCRAGLATHPARYVWTSHSCYVANDSPAEQRVCADLGLRLFATGDPATTPHAQYMRYLDHLLALDARTAYGDGGWTTPVAPPPCVVGNDHWASEYASAASDFTKPRAAISMYDVATQLLLRLDPQFSLDLLRSGTHRGRVSTIRRQLIAALLVRGFRGTAIARFFGISDSAVSRVAVSLRT